MYADGDHFVAECTVKGRRYRKRFKAAAEARTWEAQTKALGHPPAVLVAPRHPLGEVAAAARRGREEWRNSRDPSLGQRLEYVLGFFGPESALEGLSHARLLDMVRALQTHPGRSGRGLSGKTVNRYLAVVSGLLDFARRQQWTAHSPHIPWQREGEGRIVYLPQDRETSFYSRLAPDVALCVRVLASTGLRPSELFSLEPDQIEQVHVTDGETGRATSDFWLRLWSTKTDKPRSVPLDPVLGRPLLAMLHAGTLPTHESCYAAVKAAARAEGLPESFCLYSIRHTAGTWMAQRGVNGPAIQKMLGHTDYRTTQRYIHLSDSDVARAADAIRPRLRDVKAATG